MHPTKKEKLAQYDAVVADRDLLLLYFYDTETKRKPDAREREGNTFAALYRATSASGGYVVIRHKDHTAPSIELFEACKDRYAKYYDNESLPIRLCLERLWIARNKLYTAQATSR